MGNTATVVRLQEFEDAVLPFMEEGIRSVRRLASTVLAVDPNNMKPEYENMRQAIEVANTSLDSAEKAATAKLEEVNDYHSKLIVENNRLYREKENKISDLANVKLQLNSNSEMLQTHRNQLEVARNDVTSKKQVLDKMLDRVEEDKRNTNIGIGMMFIPFIGPIIGATLIGVSQADLNNARDAAERAEQVLRDSESNVNEYSRRVSECESQMAQKREEMRNVSAQIEKIASDIAEVSRMSKIIANVQENFKHATNMLGQLAGSASVLEVQTRKFIFLEPLVLILADVAEKMSQISGNDKYRLLHVNDAAPLVTYLKENLPKLQAICCQENQ